MTKSLFESQIQKMPQRQNLFFLLYLSCQFLNPRPNWSAEPWNTSDAQGGCLALPGLLSLCSSKNCALDADSVLSLRSQQQQPGWPGPCFFCAFVPAGGSSYHSLQKAIDLRGRLFCMRDQRDPPFFFPSKTQSRITLGWGGVTHHPPKILLKISQKSVKSFPSQPLGAWPHPNRLNFDFCLFLGNQPGPPPPPDHPGDGSSQHVFSQPAHGPPSQGL